MPGRGIPLRPRQSASNRGRRHPQGSSPGRARMQPADWTQTEREAASPLSKTVVATFGTPAGASCEGTLAARTAASGSELRPEGSWTLGAGAKGKGDGVWSSGDGDGGGAGGDEAEGEGRAEKATGMRPRTNAVERAGRRLPSVVKIVLRMVNGMRRAAGVRRGRTTIDGRSARGSPRRH